MSDSIDKLEFYIETTTYLATMIDNSSALSDLFSYMAKILPLHALSWHHYDSKSNTINFNLVVTSNGIYETKGLKTDLSADTRQTIERLNQSNHMIVENVSKNPLTAIIADHLSPYIKPGTMSMFLMNLNWLDVYHGHLCIFSKKSGSWNHDHIELLMMLKRPFAFAARHIKGYIELINAKENALDEKEFLSQELLRITESKLIGGNSGLREIMKVVEQLSGVDTPVLIVGETGVGKEMVADAIYRASQRRERPYIKVNCGAIPESLIDTELFGHEKGAFTGAHAPKKGKFERADGGTIFLDEIGELPLQAQIRLLRVLQNREMERVGGTRTIPVDVRFITATHRNLQEMLRKGLFREDLFYRLNVFPIVVPPLRHRKQDIPALVEHLVKKKVKEMKLYHTPSLEPKAMEMLMEHDWPGNVRELENLIERALIINPRGPLGFNHLIYAVTTNRNDKSKGNRKSFLPLDEHNRIHIRNALVLSKGKINGPGGAAELLHIGPNTLRRRMDKLGIAYGKKIHN